ncbi:Gfo/Idh/MocA family protein [Paenibacillus sp. strain BS8-2]
MKVGVIGYGLRISNVIAELKKVNPACTITAIVDPNEHAIKAKQLDVLAQAEYYESARAMIDAGGLDGIMIGTRCNLHTELALQVLPSRIPLFLEKPVATTMADLQRLKAGYEESRAPVCVSFPLRATSIVKQVKEIIDSGRIGTVEHVQAVNNVPYGAVYYHNWYRDASLTGGLFLQKATHDFDYINYILGMTPVTVSAMTSKQIYKGSKPAGLTCKTCSENTTCPESTAFAEDATIRESWTHCVFGEDTGNEDSGSALVMYDTGMHLSYSQNFFARRGAAARGARFLGYKGTLEFDFYTSQIKVFMHHTGRTETYDFDAGDDHFGGDRSLVVNFNDMMLGKGSSISSLDDGLLSALQCLKAQESARTHTFQQISWD